MTRFIFALVLCANATVVAQLPQIRITGVFPPGGQRGTSLDVTVTAGADLDEATELLFSHPGLKATAKRDGKGNPIANKFAVSVDAAIEPGLYDVRLRGLFGISNPRVFRVDILPEVAEAEPNNTDEQAQEIAINTIVNARSNSAADVDVFKINVSASQTIVIRSEASRIDSMMQPVLELFDANGSRVAHSRRKNKQEAVIVYASASEQTLILKVHDTVYAGSNDYGYRLAIDTRPLVDFTSPAILPFNVKSPVTLFGRNLPGGEQTAQFIDGVPLLKQQASVTITPAMQQGVGTDSAAVAMASVLYPGVDGNLLPFSIGSPTTHHAEAAPVVAASPPQVIAIPAVVTGNFAVEMDEDTYRFNAKKGEKWQIEVLADRLGSAADPLLIVEQITKDAEGKEVTKRLAREEINKQNPGGANLPTLTTDPAFLLNAPADGTYQLRVKDRYAASRGIPNLTYSISIQKPKPGFVAVLFDSLPSADGKAPPGTGAICLRKGGTYQIPIYAYRHGGHNEDIRIEGKDIPFGLKLSETVIRAGQSSAQLVITAPADAPEIVGTLNLNAVSATSGEAMPVRIATLVHAGANGLPRTGRVCNSLMVGIMKDEEPVNVATSITTAEVSQDQQLLLPLKVTRRAGFDDKVDLVFTGQPKNVDVPKVSIAKGTDTALARFFFKENAPVGPATLVMYATAKVSYSRNPWQVDRAKEKVAQAVAQLEATKKLVIAGKAAAEAGAKKTAELTAMLKTYEDQLKAEQVAQTKIQTDLKAAVATKAGAAKQLLALQQELAAVAANTKPENEDLDAAIKEVQEATAALSEATKPIATLTARLASLNTQIGAKQKVVAEKAKLVADAKLAMGTQQKAVEKAKADMVAAEARVKSAEAEKKAADEVVKKAEAAAKAQAKNVRAIAVPVQVIVHTTPGKIVAAVPGGGAIKKGASVDVKVTLTRKNKFAGPVKVSLILPEGEARIASNAVDIAADKTEAVLKFTAKADAAAGAIANAVVRAIADFNGRQASFDVPVTLKITD